MLVERRYTAPVFVFEDIPDTELDNPQVDTEEMTLSVADGFIMDPYISGRISAGDPVPSRTLSDALLWGGEWMGLFSGDGMYALVADFHGFSALSYTFVLGANGRGDLVVSPSFRAITAYLRDRGISLSLDQKVILPHLVSNIAYFRSRNSLKTFVAGVSTIKIDECFVISDSGWEIIARPDSKLHLLSYEELLDLGISRSKSMLQRAGSLGRNNYLALSGGRDSRVCLALMLAAGVEKDFSFMTERPANFKGAYNHVLSRDLELASLMVDHYDLNWYVPTSGQPAVVGLETVLNDWQDTRGARHFELGLHSVSRRGMGQVRVTGFGGEFLRGGFGSDYANSFPGWWAAAGKTPATVTDDLNNLFEAMISRRQIPYSLYSNAKEHFVESLTNLSSGNAVEAFEESFPNFRGRTHFASYLYFYETQGISLLSPLECLEFYYASLKVSDADRREGKVLFDVIERCAPDLNALPLEAGEWPDSFRSSGTESVWSEASVGAASKRYVEQASSVVQPPTLFADKRYDFAQAAKERITSTLSQISGYDSAYFLANLIPRLVFRAQLSPTSLVQALAVVETVADALLPRTVSTVEVKVAVEKDSSEVVLRSAGERNVLSTMDALDLGRLFDEEWERTDVSNVSADLRFDGISGEVVLELHNLPEQCEAAVYLFDHRERVEVCGYQLGLEFTFEYQATPQSDLEARVFLRPAGVAGEVQRVFSV